MDSVCFQIVGTAGREEWGLGGARGKGIGGGIEQNTLYICIYMYKLSNNKKRSLVLGAVYAYGHVWAKPSTAQLGSLQSHTPLKKTQLPIRKTSTLQWGRKDQPQVRFCLMDLISAILYYTH